MTESCILFHFVSFTISLKFFWVQKRSTIGNLSGSLYLTNFRLIFLSHNRSSYEESRTEFGDFYSISLNSIDRIEEFGSNFQCGLQISSKDWRDLTFGFPSESQKNSCSKKLRELLKLEKIEQVFAFTNKLTFFVPFLNISFFQKFLFFPILDSFWYLIPFSPKKRTSGLHLAEFPFQCLWRIQTNGARWFCLAGYYRKREL